MKKLIVLVLLLTVSMVCHAIRLENGKDVVIREAVYEDLYISGGTIEIAAPVHGDLIITGGNITINDTVTGDILLAGGTAVFNGFVGDDIRCAGGKLFIRKNVTGDLVAAGGEILVDSNASLGGLLATGGELKILGTIRGGANVSGGKLDFSGHAEKDADFRAEEVNINGLVAGKTTISAEKLTLGPNALFHNDVRYWTKKGETDFSSSIRNGQAIFDKSLARQYPRWEFLGFASILGLLWYLGATLLVIMLLQYLFSRSFGEAGLSMLSKPLKSLGYGFLFFIAIPVLAVLALVTVIGVPIGLMLIFLYFAAIVFSGALTSLVVANGLRIRQQKNWGYWAVVFIALGIAVLLNILFIIPYLGWLILFVLICIGFGALLLNIRFRKPGVAPLVATHER